MPRGTPASDTLKPELVKELCSKIKIKNSGEIYNPENGTITKKLLQEVCNYKGLPSNLNKEESAIAISEKLKINLNNIDYNPKDGTVSAGFIEKIIKKI